MRRLLNSVAAGDYKTYEQLCDREMTCLEDETCGHIVQGLGFHKHYFDLARSRAERPSLANNSISSPHVRMLGPSARSSSTKCPAPFLRWPTSLHARLAAPRRALAKRKSGPRRCGADRLRALGPERRQSVEGRGDTGVGAQRRRLEECPLPPLKQAVIRPGAGRCRRARA